MYTKENAADQAVAVLWACATDDDHKFSGGQPTSSCYTSYYSYAYGNAWTALVTWIMDGQGVAFGYDKNYTVEGAADALRLAEEILEAMAEVGPESVRALRNIALAHRPDVIDES
jgi:hypothetical protein